MGWLGQAALTLALSAVVIFLLSRGPAARWPQGAMLAVGAITVGLIALAVFFGGAGAGFGLLCAGGLAGGALALYGILWLMERWARGSDE